MVYFMVPMICEHTISFQLCLFFFRRYNFIL